jgi:uncharacterized phiE125 gp8 family phage protein
MNLKRVTEPLYEPLSVDDLQAHLRVDSDADYPYIQSLIMVAREHVEDETGQTLMPTTWELQMDTWPTALAFELPMAPLRSVTSIKHVTDAGAETVFSSSNYIVDAWASPGRVALVDGATWPSDDIRSVGGVRVRFVAGYADMLDVNSTVVQVAAARNAIPERARHAMRLIVGHLYENREQVVMGAGLVPAQLPMGVSYLLMPMRVWSY